MKTYAFCTKLNRPVFVPVSSMVPKGKDLHNSPYCVDMPFGQYRPKKILRLRFNRRFFYLVARNSTEYRTLAPGCCVFACLDYPDTLLVLPFPYSDLEIIFNADCDAQIGRFEIGKTYYGEKLDNVFTIEKRYTVMDSEGYSLVTEKGRKYYIDKTPFGESIRLLGEDVHSHQLAPLDSFSKAHLLLSEWEK